MKPPPPPALSKPTHNLTRDRGARQVRETSVKGLLNPRRYLTGGPGSKSADEVRRDFKDIVLQEGLHDQARGGRRRGAGEGGG